MKLSEVQCVRRLPANLLGRDFVVGDLHGRRVALETELDRLGFDVRFDRVISVGDLVSRGPHSLETLALVDEPWFHAVLGNHELMVLNHLGFFRSRQHKRQTYAGRKGAWLAQALHAHRRRVWSLAEKLAHMPMVICVDGQEAFRVMHGDLEPLGPSPSQLLAGSTIDIHLAERLTLSRIHLAEVLAADRRLLAFDDKPVSVSRTPKGLMPLTYVGHSPMPSITAHNSHVYIDQGLRKIHGCREAACCPTVVNHGQFSLWLDGVAAGGLAGSSVMKSASKPMKLTARSAGMVQAA
jgi:serine/threonine protein phosphatase 1